MQISNPPLEQLLQFWGHSLHNPLFLTVSVTDKKYVFGQLKHVVEVSIQLEQDEEHLSQVVELA